MQYTSSLTVVKVSSALRTFTTLAAVAALLTGLLVSLGWALDLDALKQILPGLATMKPLTAFGFLLVGLGLWGSRRENDPGWNRLGLICAGLAVLIGGLVLLEHGLNVHFGLDQILFREGVLAEGGPFPGRPASATALGLLLLGLALFTLDAAPRWLMPAFALPALLIALLAVVGYVFSVGALYQIPPYSSMALHTAVLFVVVALGVLSVRPEHPVPAVITNNTSGGQMARRFLPAAIAVLLVAFWLVLTGLFNRRYLEESFARELRRAERSGQTVGVILLDIDHFKQVNDTYGHDTGDAVLRALGDHLRAHIRGGDIACRFGGEEFVLILPETPLEIARHRADQLREGFRQLSIQHEGRAVGTLTLSLGVAIYPAHGGTDEAVLKAADTALYRAKQAGRDRVVTAAEQASL